MTSSIRTDTAQLGVTAQKTADAVSMMANHARDLKGAIDDLGRWNGEAKRMFLQGMGINLPELEKMTTLLDRLAENLRMTGTGVMSNEADASKTLAAAGGSSSLSGPSLNHGVA